MARSSLGSRMASKRQIQSALKTIRRLDSDTARALFHKILTSAAKTASIRLPFSSEPSRAKPLNASAANSVDVLAQAILENPDMIDIIYSHIVPQNYRRQHGQFTTPPEVAAFMVSWGISQNRTSILDPAVGPGVFLAKYYSMAREGGLAEKIHMTGIDIDPLLLNACYLRLKLLGIKDDALTLVKKNFLAYEPVSNYDFVVCNPPYIKFHGFDRNMVDKIASEAGLQLTKLTNIYTLFLVHSTGFLKDGGLAVFITPSEFLYTGYGVCVKRFLLDNYTVEAFALVALQEKIFEGAMTTAVITILRKEEPDIDHKVRFAVIPPEAIRHLTLESLDEFVVRELRQKLLDPRKKWLLYFTSRDLETLVSRLVPLSQLASVDRGIATGCNEFFTLNEATVKKFNIPYQYLKPVISKASHCPHYEFTHEDWEYLRRRGERVFLLYCFTDEPPAALRKYLEYGLKLGVHRRYIPSHRRVWYYVDRRKPAPILALVFSRERMRFVWNKAGVLNLTPFHCVYPRFNDKLKLKALLAYLNSNICKEIATYWGRVYGTGLRKLEPGDLERLPVLDVHSLSHSELETLARLFDRLCSASRRGEDETPIKEEIDRTIRRVLMKTRKRGLEAYFHFQEA